MSVLNKKQNERVMFALTDGPLTAEEITNKSGMMIHAVRATIRRLVRSGDARRWGTQRGIAIYCKVQQ